MKHVCLICVIFLACIIVSCGGKKAKEVIVEEEISAEAGGTIATTDESVTIEIPAEAIDANTTITMVVEETKDYPVTKEKNEKVISKVVRFEPSMVFKKPVIITMKSSDKIENKIITAAVYNEEKKEWSYSDRGVAVKLKQNDDGGDPIMLSAGGDPIMLDDGGDPIMLGAGGDPIMITTDGKQMMRSAAGDPIMMATGHFSVFTFIAIEPKGRQECNETHNTPCTDWSNGLWSKGLMWSSISKDKMNWDSAKSYCENNKEEGYEDWKLPDINELRTLIQNCEGSQAGGECKVSEPDHLDSEYHDEEKCTCESKENNDGYYSRLGDADGIWLWSSSTLTGITTLAWSVDFSNAHIYTKDKVDAEIYLRCVREEAGPEMEKKSESEPTPEPAPEHEQEPDSDPESE